MTTHMREDNILNLVMTTKEASETYSVADCTFRTWIKDGLFEGNEIKKSGNTWLIKKEAIEEVLKRKKMYGKTFTLGTEEFYAEFMGYRGDKLQIWYEDEEVREILEQMPQKELIPQMFEIFKKEKQMNFKFIVISNNRVENNNWLFRKEKVWSLTLKGVIETVRESMIIKGFDTAPMNTYLESLGLDI